MDIGDYNESDLFALLITKKRELMSWYTDESLTDGGIGLLRIMSHLGYLLLQRINNRAKEAFLPTAKERSSVIDIAQTLSYKLRPNKAAVIRLAFTASGATTVPQGTKVQRPESAGNPAVIFETNEELVFTGVNTKSIYATHGETKSEEFTATGSKNESFELTYNPLIYGSVQVNVSGVEGDWEEVNHFIKSESTDKHFIVDTDENDKITVAFGDGFNGKILTEDATVTITYRVGGGDIGNVGTGTVTELLTSVPKITDVTNGPIAETVLTKDVETSDVEVEVDSTAGFLTAGTIYIENDQITYTDKTGSKFTGVTGLSVKHFIGATVWLTPVGNRGVDKETVSQAKYSIPAHLRSLERGVSLTDYQNIILDKFKQDIAQAKAYEMGGFVLVAILPPDGGLPSDALVTDVQNYIRSVKMARENVMVVKPTLIAVDCKLSVRLAPFYNFTVTKSEIEEAVENFFDPVYRIGENQYIRTWGDSVYRSLVIKEAFTVPGVIDVVLTELKRSSEAADTLHDIIVTSKEIVCPGSITVASADIPKYRRIKTPGIISEEEWRSEEL